MTTLAKQLFCFLALSGIFYFNATAQDDGNIRTVEGVKIGNKRTYIAQCKKAYSESAGDAIVTKACLCQAGLLDRRFTIQQLQFYQKKYKEQAMDVLIEQDVALQKQMKECSEEADHLLLVSLPEYRKSFIKNCVDNLKLKSTQPVNDTLAAIFCNCAASIMEKRKITLERYEELADPTSFLYNEISYNCGSPFSQAI